MRNHPTGRMRRLRAVAVYIAVERSAAPVFGVALWIYFEMQLRVAWASQLAVRSSSNEFDDAAATAITGNGTDEDLMLCRY